MNDEFETEISGYRVGDRIMYSSNGKPGSHPRDRVGLIERWNGGPPGYRVCWIMPEGKVDGDFRVLRLEDEIEPAQ
jgi:hypothetical protein